MVEPNVWRTTGGGNAAAGAEAWHQIMAKMIFDQVPLFITN